MHIKHNRGFTLTQTVIALSLIAAISAAVVGMYNTSETKAAVLIGRVQQITTGLMLAKQDLNCFPTRLDALLKPTNTTVCGAVTGDLWRGAYIGLGTPYDPGTGNIIIDDIVPNAQIAFQTRTLVDGAGVTTYSYVLTTVGITPEFAYKAQAICGNDPDSRCGIDSANQIFWIVETGAAPKRLEYNEATGVFSQVP